jgi:phosphoribosylformylglycinamidine synthase
LELYRAFHKAVTQGLVASAHDCSDGGLGVALAETAMAGRLGLRAELASVPTQGELDSLTLLFSESLGRLVVTVAAEHADAFEAAMAGHTVARVGTITAEASVVLVRDGQTVVDASVDSLVAAWKKPFAA